MESLPVAIYSAAQVRAMDRHVIESCGIPAYELMKRAGAAAFASLRRNWPEAADAVVLCGSGNNAGDGYVLAQRARQARMPVTVFALAAPERLQGAAAAAFGEFHAAGGRARSFDASALAKAALVVDALLGTGLARDVAGPLRACIDSVNSAGRPVLALDVPSGLDADSGLVRGAAIHAARTITFVGLKAGLFLGAAPDHVGVLEFAGLGIPDSARAGIEPCLERLGSAALAGVLKPRRRSAHKGEHGRVLIVGGHAMAGAARLAGEAALRSGAGIVTVATASAQVAAIVVKRPELIVAPADSADALAPLATAADAIAIGPGLGLGDAASRLLDAVAATPGPIVVDADALTLLARAPRRHHAWVLTPHPGEAARLLGSDVAAVQRDRLGAAQAIVAKYGGACVLKGANSIVAAPSATPALCDRGNPGMATPGSGDVLTGVIASFAGAGAGIREAAAAGVWIHATAGDRAAGARPRGLIASDLLEELRTTVNEPWS